MTREFLADRKFKAKSYIDVIQQCSRDCYRNQLDAIIAEEILLDAEKRGASKEERGTLSKKKNDAKNAFETSRKNGLTILKEQDFNLASDKIILNHPTADQLDDLINPTPDLSLLPPFSFWLKLQFRLLRPFLSKDDNPFHLHENPIRRDKLYGHPYLAATTWKGALRWAFYQTAKKENGGKVSAGDRLLAVLLFGDESRAIEDWLGKDAAFNALLAKQGLKGKSHRGRLSFYPTFFNKVSVEVINPHERDKKKGKHPIYFDAVPAGETGIFRVLYTPFDLMGQPQGVVAEKALEDAFLVIPTVSKLINYYGVSAKRSSGYGAMIRTCNDQDCFLLRRSAADDVRKVPLNQMDDNLWLRP